MVFLEILQHSQENTCARISFFNKFADLRPATLLKKRLWHRCFTVNSTKFLRTPFLTEHLRWLLLIKVLLKELTTDYFLQEIFGNQKNSGFIPLAAGFSGITEC